MDFNNKVLAIVHIFGKELWITETIRNTWVIMIALTIFSIFVRIKLKKFEDVPNSKLQNIVELGIESFINFVNDTLGHKYNYLGNWFFGIFVMVLCCNLSGLLGMRPPTADITTTACFGLSTFFLIHFFGITQKKGEYFKEFIEPTPLMLPIHLLGELAVPISLSCRLFGNILGGLIILGIIYSLPIYLKTGIPAFLHIYFDMFAGCLQSFIIVMLSMTFIKNKLPEEVE